MNNVNNCENLEEEQLENVSSLQKSVHISDDRRLQLFSALSPYSNSSSPFYHQSITTSQSSLDILDKSDDNQSRQINQQFQNPELPLELVNGELVNADNIGDTVFSKHWVFTLLIKILKICESPEANINDIIDKIDSFEEDLCQLWDMSMNMEVALFLLEFNIIELLIGAINTITSSRIKEICLGILANISYYPAVCQQLSSDPIKLKFVLSMMQNDDGAVLVEIFRLLNCCISNKSSSSLWINGLKDTSFVFPRILFILQSSTNDILLNNTADFIDKTMELDDEFCFLWSSPELVLSIMEAIKQIGAHSANGFDVYLHILQLVSTSESGVQSLETYAGEVCLLAISYLKLMDMDDIVDFKGKEYAIASALAILNVTFKSWDGHLKLLNEDNQLIRCLVKIFESVMRRLIEINDDENKPNLNVQLIQSPPNDHQKQSSFISSDTNSTDLVSFQYVKQITNIILECLKTLFKDIFSMLGVISGPEVDNIETAVIETIDSNQSVQFLNSCPKNQMELLLLVMGGGSLLKIAQTHKCDRLSSIISTYLKYDHGMFNNNSFN